MVRNPTNTGLDRLVNIIETDFGLRRRTPQDEIDAGAQAANNLNKMILRGIEVMGLANDGEISAADFRSLGEWAQSFDRRLDYFEGLYGTSRNGVETGFQLVERDNGLVRLFNAAAIDEVADAIYSFGFGAVNGQILDVNGNTYRSLELTAGWLDRLLTDADKAALFNSRALIDVEGSTGTGLDRLVKIVNEDPGLAYHISSTDIAKGAKAVDSMNKILINGIKGLGLANDLEIDESDVIALDEWMRADSTRFANYDRLRGDDQGGVQTGYQLIYLEGARTGYVGIDDGIHAHTGHVINHAYRGLFQIGNGVENGKLLNEDGEIDNPLSMVAAWLDQLLTDRDMRSLENKNRDVNIDGTTGTGLDRLVDVINTDPGINRTISSLDIAEAADAADTMNHMILDGISVLDLVDDFKFNGSDLRELSGWIRGNAGRKANFERLYGDSKNNGEETGFQLVERDGGLSKIFGTSAINGVADAIYSIGFGTVRGQIRDDNGAPYRSIDLTANWIDRLLTDADMTALSQSDGGWDL